MKKIKYGKPQIVLSEEAQLAQVLKVIGFRVNRARLTIVPTRGLSGLDITERQALEVLKTKYHFLVLPMDELDDIEMRARVDIALEDRKHKA